MRLAAIKFAGFRGARGTVALEIPPGFLVVSGRNGSGKSTICDAIEFALTGEIRASIDHKEKGESILDYLWWRGDPPPAERYVELVLQRDDGDRVIVRRTPTEIVIDPFSPLDELLCHTTASLDRPMVRLCRTGIIRDEVITQLSIDLKEANRFEFVRSALGTANFTGIEQRAKDVHDLVAAEAKRAEQTYVAASARTSNLTTRLSQARTELTTAEEVGAADSMLRDLLNESQSGTDQMIRRAEQHLAELRLAADALTRLHTRIQSWETRRDVFMQTQQMQELHALTEQLGTARRGLETVEESASAARDELGKVEEQSPTNASFAALHEHGQRLGLINGCCPLCGIPHDEEAFQAHLTDLGRRIAASNARLSDLTKQSAESAANLLRAQTEFAQLEARLASLKHQSAGIDAERDVIAREAEGLGFTGWLKEQPDLARIGRQIEAKREELRGVDRALAVVQASRVVDEVKALEEELKSAREEVVKADKRVARVNDAANRTKAALDTVRRVRGEYVNDMLAQLEPLLIELYERLRPHMDWPEVRYRLRGEVRHMLSFEVGDGLNPSFLFSSGQRRAAGIAFLLALHLSRNWCKLKTLILDDPVQHIDDYRALHLTEILAAIRRTGQQIICTVEDESLAGLLARRLRSDTGDEGAIVRMKYTSRNGVEIRSSTPVKQFQKHLLVSA